MSSFYWVIMLTISTALALSTCQDLHPVILVPGNGGNQLEARLTSRYEPTSPWCSRWLNPFCKDKNGWFRLWFDPKVVIAPFTNCFNDRMMLYYDPVADDYNNAPGVETRVPDFGSTRSLLYLNPNLKKITSYMAPLVETLESMGYVDGKTLFGAPYDFRYGLAADGHPSTVGSKFLEDLRDLIETASRSNGGKRAILVSHSLGGLFVLQLLKRSPSAWRNRYVKHLITLSAPWGGTIDQMRTFASGNTLGVPFVDPLRVRPQQRSSESNQWLLPSRSVFNPNKPMVIAPGCNYSVCDMERFLNDIGFCEGVWPYKTRVLPLTEDLASPNVSVTCIYGTGIKTPEILVYGNGRFDEQPEVKFGDGDGTVNLASLSAVETLWADTENQSLKSVRIPGVSHTAILQDAVALEKISKEIDDINF